MSGSDKRQRTCLTAVRMTPDEKQRLEAAAAAKGISVGRFIREAALLSTEKATALDHYEYALRNMVG